MEIDPLIPLLIDITVAIVAMMGALFVVSMITKKSYVITGKVEHGLKIGRELGFPTANLVLDLKFKKPYGVYIANVRIGKQKKRGLLYYGPRMTKGLPETIVCEVTIFDFDEDLYGKNMKLSLGSFIRGPKEFDSPAELRRQIERDVMVARNKKI